MASNDDRQHQPSSPLLPYDEIRDMFMNDLPTRVERLVKRQWPEEVSQPRIVSDDIGGGYNHVFKVDVNPELQCVLKIPKIWFSDGWTAAHEHHMTMVVHTMRLIKKWSSIPIPSLHSYGLSPENLIGAPYIFEERIQGITAHEAWRDRSATPEALRMRTTQTIRDVARSMVYLTHLAFNGIGAPEFDENGKLQHDGEICTVGNFMWLSDFESQPSHDTATYIKSFFQRSLRMPLDFYTVTLRMMLDWTIQMVPEERFALFHPDLNAANIIVDPETGRLNGIIDWDFVHATSLSLGIHSFPAFINDDFDHRLRGGEAYKYDVCEGTLSCGPHPRKPFKPEDTELRNHEGYDYCRAIWRASVEHYEAQLGRDVPVELTIQDLLDTVPCSYEAGLTKEHSLSMTVLRDASVFTWLLRPAIGHLLGMIQHTALTASNATKNAIQSQCFALRKAKAIEFLPSALEAAPHHVNSDHAPGMDTAIPSYAKLVEDVCSGRLEAGHLLQLKAWFNYLMYAPQKGQVAAPHLVAEYSSDTLLCAGRMLGHLVSDSHEQWKDYMLPRYPECYISYHLSPQLLTADVQELPKQSSPIVIKDDEMARNENRGSPGAPDEVDESIPAKRKHRVITQFSISHSFGHSTPETSTGSPVGPDDIRFEDFNSSDIELSDWVREGREESPSLAPVDDIKQTKLGRKARHALCKLKLSVHGLAERKLGRALKKLPFA
ncbi:MAG: hypothetical protein Q9162_002296 [Coniocarpon cinnabarinum]